jgi:hypothetical protein
MIENNIKTALFASLTVALLIPFSLMDSSNAEKVTDSLTIPNEERDLKLAAGYKLYPGVGWVAPEEQDIVQPIYVENPNKPGEMILNIDAMIEEQKRLEEAKVKKTSGDFFIDIFNQFVQLAEATLTSYHIAAKDDSSNDITYQRAFW